MCEKAEEEKSNAVLCTSSLFDSPTSVVSLLRRLVISPVLVTSKNPLEKRGKHGDMRQNVQEGHGTKKTNPEREKPTCLAPIASP